VNPSFPSPVKVKICGVTLPEQARAIAEAGADFIGLNFWSGSKRYLAPEVAATWLSDVADRVSFIGVVVNADEGYLRELARLPGLIAIQLHGDETPAFCEKLVSQGLRVIKAIQVRGAAALADIADYPVQDVLLDAYHPNVRGGIGETFPWELAAQFQRLYPERRLWLAGGLTPANVDQAVAALHPFAVDTASGVESGQPGIKDLAKTAAFIAAAKRGNAGP